MKAYERALWLVIWHWRRDATRQWNRWYRAFDLLPSTVRLPGTPLYGSRRQRGRREVNFRHRAVPQPYIRIHVYGNSMTMGLAVSEVFFHEHCSAEEVRSG